MPVCPGVVASVRNERIDLILAGIQDAELQPLAWQIPDYSASRALELVRRFEGALGYFCLADPLAVAVLQLLEYRGVAATNQRVVGFDDVLAKDFGIPSFRQHLPEVGTYLVKKLADFFRNQMPGGSVKWPEFEERGFPIQWVQYGRKTPTNESSVLIKIP
jgi:DNA-binding LacI/PurR family transcriptional regulator